MQRYRPWFVLGILLVTFTLIGRFFLTHPEYLRQLSDIRPVVVAEIVGLYCLAICALVWVYDATLKLCGHTLRPTENALLTAYSTIANFFGPLQSGPGVRAVYLKARHNVRLRDYTLASLIYYGLFATYSALFLLVAKRPWWQTVLVLVCVGTFSGLVIRFFLTRDKKRAGSGSRFAFRPSALMSLMAATFVQVSLIAIIYFVELHTINPAIHFGQAVSYSGASNFALFVSLTPGAIGFREAFLIFSQQIHGISTATILGANIIDRSVYLVFLMLLLVLALAVNAKGKLRLKQIEREASQTKQ